MKKKLYPYQIEGARYLATHPHALLADEPGLGKTLQAIAAAEILGLKRILVVCPASVRLNWKQEVEECLGGEAASGWQVISYHGASNAVTRAVLDASYEAIILDEAHFLKTPDSQRTQAVFGPEGLARRAKHKWALTGTPVLNRPRELYPMVKSLAPRFSDISWSAYTQRYCGAYFDGRGMNTKGATHLDELRGRLDGFMIRRTKAEVLPDLPPKRYARIPLEVSAADLKFVIAEEALISDRESKISSVHEDFSQLGDLAHLLRLTGEAKVRATVEYICDLLETTDKIVVFAKHREVIRKIEDALKLAGRGSVVYHGGMSDTQKRDAVNIFKARRGVEVFIGQIQAAGTGINGLQEVASQVVFAELSWVPGETGQAVDRLHRIGQKADSVLIHLPHVPGTLESAVLSTHDRKENIIDRLMGDDILGDLA